MDLNCLHLAFKNPNTGFGTIPEWQHYFIEIDSKPVIIY